MMMHCRRNCRVVFLFAGLVVLFVVMYEKHFSNITIPFPNVDEMIEDDSTELYAWEQYAAKHGRKASVVQGIRGEEKHTKEGRKNHGTLKENANSSESKLESKQLPPCTFCVRNFRAYDPNYQNDIDKATELKCKALTCIPPPDYYKPRPEPVNRFEFYKNLITPNVTCHPNGTSVLMIVHTKPGGFELRSLWRRVTKAFLKANPNFIILFMLGYTSNQTEWKLIVEESKNRSDIIAYSFLDSYSSLPTKTAMMLQWCTQKCKTLDYLIKVDDDMFFNPKNLLETLEAYSDRLMIAGRMNFHHEVHRDPRDPLYVPFEQYPYQFWPNFQAGGLYIVSGVAVPKLWKVAPYIPLVNLEDAWVTTLGIAANVDRVFPNDFANRRPEAWVDKRRDAICATAEKQVGYLVSGAGRGHSKMDLEKVWNECLNASAVNF